LACLPEDGRGKVFFSPQNRLRLFCDPPSRLFCGYRFIPPERVKIPEREVCNSRSPSAEVRNEWSYTSAPLYTIMACTGTDRLYNGLAQRHDERSEQTETVDCVLVGFVLNIGTKSTHFTSTQTSTVVSICTTLCIIPKHSTAPLVCDCHKNSCFFLVRINRLVFVTKKQCVFCKVRMKCLCIARLCTIILYCLILNMTAVRTVETSVNQLHKDTMHPPIFRAIGPSSF